MTHLPPGLNNYFILINVIEHEFQKGKASEYSIVNRIFIKRNQQCFVYFCKYIKGHSFSGMNAHETIKCIFAVF